MLGFTGIGACIDNCGDGHTFSSKVMCCPVPIIVIGEDRHGMRRCCGPAIDIGAHCACQHDARTIVLFKSDRPLRCTGRENCLFCIDTPQNLTGLSVSWDRHVIADALKRTINAMIKRADHCCSWHNPDIRHCAQLSNGCRSPVARVFIADCVRLGIQPATQQEIFIRKDNLGPCARSRERSHQTRRARADHQQIAMPETLIVTVWVVL